MYEGHPEIFKHSLDALKEIAGYYLLFYQKKALF